jgi:hypothetical protein
MKKTWQYKWWDPKASIGVVIFTIIIILVQWFGTDEPSSWGREIQIAGILAAVLFVWMRTALLTEHYVLSSNGITIKHFFKKNFHFDYQTVKRITVRKLLHPITGEERRMTISLKNGKHHKILVSALKEEAAFLRTLENYTQDISIIYQEEDGSIIPKSS